MAQKAFMAQPFTEHDIEHTRLANQVQVLQQIVLKLCVIEAKRLAKGDKDLAKSVARSLVRKSVEPLREAPPNTSLSPAEQHMFQDEHNEMFEDLEQHLDHILSGSL
jgi:hypothetical protein